MKIFKRIVKSVLNFPSSIYNRLLFVFYKVKIGKKRRIRGRLFVRNHGVVHIGDYFLCNSNLKSNPVGGPYRTTLVVSSNAKLIIGNKVGISGVAIICNKEITIEDNVLIGSGCCIYDTDFHSVEYSERVLQEDAGVNEKPVHIKEGAFIGARTIVLKGVTIGAHSIIGAGSVVTKSVPDNELWAGNPAVFRRKL